LNMLITELITDLNNRGLQLSVDTAGQLLATGPVSALTPDIKTRLAANKAHLIRHLSPRWVPPEITRAAFSAAQQAGYWPGDFDLAHPIRGKVLFSDPGRLLAATTDIHGLEPLSVPIVNGQVIAAGPVTIEVVKGLWLFVDLDFPYDADFVSDLEATIPPAARTYDEILRCWGVDPLYSMGLADVILAHYQIHPLQAINTVQQGVLQ
jgi:hypothetical protein